MAKILILSSNPRRDLNLDREISDLSAAVQRLGTFEIRLGLGVTAQQLPALLAEHSPQIVHFCGHGAAEQGLVFQDENGREQFVSTELLERIFKTFAQEIQCTVLNACDSDLQSAAIAQYINYVIGMSQPILDKAAHLFSIGFYQGLGAGKSIEQAYEMGCIAIQIWQTSNASLSPSRQLRKLITPPKNPQPEPPQLAEYMKPVLRKRPGAIVTAIPENRPEQSVAQAFNTSEAFVNFVQQESDRKSYKDQSRAAYDNFGQNSAPPPTALSKSEYAQRQIVLSKVKQFWIEGFLQTSLQSETTIDLKLAAFPDAITNQGIEALSVELDESFDQLHSTKIYTEIGQGRTLLILGNPGAGKTIALLQLAQRLIDRSDQDLSLPLPIVFSLPSWANERKPIVDWLIDELKEKYQVPQSLSEPWILHQQLILLLDGLDEVKEEYRNDCVRALNDFIALFPQIEIAVCCRVGDYEKLTDRLQISSAICLQPLSSQQVYQFLDKVGGSLTGLKTLLKQDTTLEQLAKTPLLLNCMSSAYQGWSAEKLKQELAQIPDVKQHLFDTYIDRCFARGTSTTYTKPQILQWLHWLASRMVKEKQTIFLIEKMQPTWLDDRHQTQAYRSSLIVIATVMVFLILGLYLWMIFLLHTPPSNAPLNCDPSEMTPYNFMRCMPNSTFKITLQYALMNGFSGAIVAGALVGRSKAITPLEKLSWSWARMKARMGREFLIGIGFGLIFSLWLLLSFLVVLWCSGERANLIAASLNFGIVFGAANSLRFGIILALGSGLGSGKVEQQSLPNQGMRNSGWNSALIGLGGGFLGGLMGAIVHPNAQDCIPIDAIVFGILFALRYGGSAWLRHVTLRHTLYRQGFIPWNYAKFLDFATSRQLMKKVGGGYLFFHRMLLEHFAQSASQHRPQDKF